MIQYYLKILFKSGWFGMYKIFFDFKTNTLKLTANGILTINEKTSTLVCEIEQEEEVILDAAGLKYVDINIVPMVHETQSFGKEHLEELAGDQKIWKKKFLIRQ